MLIEPALYDMARGDSAVENHINTMTRARELADVRDLYGYWSIVSPLMFGRPASRDRWAEDRATAERFAEVVPPWGHNVSADQFADIPALVVTGAWNEEYEAIAHRLAAVNVQHVQLEGYRHRPQDHPEFNDLLDRFEGSDPTPGE